MKRYFFLLIVFCSLHAMAQKPAKNYLIQLGGSNGSSWTKTPGANDSIVDLTVAGQTLTAWLANRTSWTTGDQVWIAAGTYSFTSYYNIGSAPSLATSFPSAIYGGFAGTETTLADRAKGTSVWDYTHETILNGATSTNGIFGAGGDRTMVVDGLTFSSCPSATANPNGEAGKGQALYQRPNMSVQNCKFLNNGCVALRYYVSTTLPNPSKSASTLNCYFANNTNTVSGGAEGGSIMANNSSAGGTYTIMGCVFDSNSSTASGSGASAGIKAQGTGNTEINKCIFKNNNATAGNSSAVSLTSATCTLKNSLIYGTSVATNKVAVYVSAGNVINCTVVNNLGGGAYLSNATTSTINLTNNVFWGEDAKSGQVSAVANCLGTITNCAYNSLSTNFTGTVTNTVDITTTTTGLFTDPTNNLWTLATGSVLVDMGTATGAPVTDLSGVTRPQGSGVDIGAYEYLLSANNPIVYEKPLFRQSGNRLTALLDGAVSIYDTTGRLHKTRTMQAGEELMLPAGIYVVQLSNSTNRFSQKILVK